MSGGVEQISSWLLGRHPDLVEIDPDHDLIDNRLVDSLSFVEFLILIEQLTGRPVDLDTVNLDDLRSLNRIEQSLFAGRQSLAAGPRPEVAH